MADCQTTDDNNRQTADSYPQGTTYDKPQRDAKGRLLQGHTINDAGINQFTRAGKPRLTPKQAAQAVLNALHRAHPGGAEGYLLELAKSSPRLFCQLLAKILPSEIHVDGSIEVRDHVRQLFAGGSTAGAIIDVISQRRQGLAPSQALALSSPILQLADAIAVAARDAAQPQPPKPRKPPKPYDPDRLKRQKQKVLDRLRTRRLELKASGQLTTAGQRHRATKKAQQTDGGTGGDTRRIEETV